MGNFDNCNPIVTDCTFALNTTSGNGGAMYNLDFSSPTITNSEFIGNSSDGVGGAIRSYNNCNTELYDCIFDGNSAGSGGGAIHNRLESNTQVTNCRFIDNAAGTRGGAVREGNCSSTLTNCTFTLNSAGIAGGGVSSGGADPAPIGNTVLNNCILWGNTAPLGLQIALAGAYPANMAVSYSNVQGGEPGVDVQVGSTVTWGPGNIDADPVFVNAINDDFRLSGGSPCVDAADNDAVPLAITTDLDGSPRFVEDGCKADTGSGAAPLVDMGAYESQCSSCDLDGNCRVDTVDFFALLAQWGSNPGGPPDFDGNGDVDVLDFFLLIANWG
jgi:hypothetical protein